MHRALCKKGSCHRVQTINIVKYRRLLFLGIISVIGLIPVEAQTHRGKASYYSKRATGARTASGERLHHDSLTCAHRKYPFGTLLKVKNVSNGKEIIVKVTDRGPYGRGRIIDLSYGAAKALGMLSQGVAMVEVRRTDGPNPPYRMDEVERGLPDFEFDFSKAAYSFIDDWKGNEEEVDHGMTEEERLMEKKMPTAKQSQEKRQKILARHNANLHATGESGEKAQSTSHTPKHQTSKAATPHHTNKHLAATKGGKQQAHKANEKNKEKDPTFWSSVFDDVKKWFGDGKNND